MLRTFRFALPVLVVTIAVVSWFVPARAQAPRQDLVPALLVEVKGLRAAMEEMASTSARSQLLVGRLQLQEGRITSMTRRLDTVRDALAAARHELDEAQNQLTSLQTPQTPGAEKEQGLAALIKSFGFVKVEDVQREVVTRQETVNRLASEEQQLVQQITAEQARWVDINQRLDELERSLVKK
jgi:DNA repair exonuclease SbcCD ATPase subunit